MSPGIHPTPMATLSAPVSLVPAVFFVGDDDDDKRTPRRQSWLLPAAFHRHAAAAAANPTGKGLLLASVGISHLSLVTCHYNANVTAANAANPAISPSPTGTNHFARMTVQILLSLPLQRYHLPLTSDAPIEPLPQGTAYPPNTALLNTASD